MKNYTEGVPVPLPQATDAETQLDLGSVITNSPPSKSWPGSESIDEGGMPGREADGFSHPLTLNIFPEPQWTVSRSGAGQPQFPMKR